MKETHLISIPLDLSAEARGESGQRHQTETNKRCSGVTIEKNILFQLVNGWNHVGLDFI